MDPRKPDVSGAAGFRVEIGVAGGVARVRVVGELDLLAAPAFEQAMAAALGGAGAGIVVDLAGVTLLTSNGVRVLVDARDRAGGAGVRLTVTGVAGNRPVARLFGLLRLQEVLVVEEDDPAGTASGTSRSP